MDMGTSTRRSRSLLSALLVAALELASCKSSGGNSSKPAPQGQDTPLRVSRGPQLAQVAPASIVIAWLSSRVALGTVEYGFDGSFGSKRDSPSVGTEHVVRLEGLVAGARYVYRILLDGTPASEGHAFETAPADPAAPFRFVVFGDTGSGSANQAAVALRTLTAAPDLVLISGDVVYDSGASSELDPHYFVPFAGLIDHIPFYPALGNHDVISAKGSSLLGAVYLPVNDTDGTEQFFSFDYANAHFAAVNSSASLTPGSLQWSWLDSDLGRSQARWKIVYFHHPPYSSSSHGSSFGIRQSLTPLFDKHHVDLVFSGHDHDYERTFPMLREQVAGVDEEPSYSDPPGTIFVVTGGGGRSLYPNGKSYFTAFSASAYHITQVDIEASSLHLEAVRADGVVIDQMRITKTVAP